MLQLEQDALYTSQRLNTEWQQLRKSEQYEGIRKKLLQNMHRAVRLSKEDGARMIEHYGYDGVYKKVSVGGNLVNEHSMNKTKVRSHGVKLLHQKEKKRALVVILKIFSKNIKRGKHKVLISYLLIGYFNKFRNATINQSFLMNKKSRLTIR